VVLDALVCIGTAVALFSVVKRQHEGFALGFVTTRMFEAAVIVIGVVFLIPGAIWLLTEGKWGKARTVLVAEGRQPEVTSVGGVPEAIPETEKGIL